MIVRNFYNSYNGNAYNSTLMQKGKEDFFRVFRRVTLTGGVNSKKTIARNLSLEAPNPRPFSLKRGYY